MIPRLQRLAETYGLPPDTPLNVVRGYATAMWASNKAHEVKAEYDANNPPAGATQADRENLNEPALPPPPHV
jgi:hypothetical protein